jgi:putative ABC transport system permease protein
VVRAGVVPGLERVAAGRESQVVLAPLDALVGTLASVQPNTAFLAADTAAARALADAEPPASLTPTGLVTDVATVRGTVERVAGLALPALVTSTYLLTAVLAGLLSLLAVLLVLAATREERASLVIRLRTLGLPHGRDRALAWAEVLPVVAAAALAGGVVGALSPWLVASALDLAPFTGAAVRPPVDPRPVVAVLAAGAVVVLGALALVLDALAARRGRLADHLRQGETA